MTGRPESRALRGGDGEMGNEGDTSFEQTNKQNYDCGQRRWPCPGYIQITQAQQAPESLGLWSVSSPESRSMICPDLWGRQGSQAPERVDHLCVWADLPRDLSGVQPSCPALISFWARGAVSSRGIGDGVVSFLEGWYSGNRVCHIEAECWGIPM